MITNAAGMSVRRPVPEEARPDCDACDKPQLHPSNFETVQLYQHVQDQQHYIGMSGNMGGVRIEAVIAAANWLYEAGEISDIDTAIQRIRAIDEERVKVHNEKIKAAHEAANNQA